MCPPRWTICIRASWQTSPLFTFGWDSNNPVSTRCCRILMTPSRRAGSPRRSVWKLGGTFLGILELKKLKSCFTTLTFRKAACFQCFPEHRHHVKALRGMFSLKKMTPFMMARNCRRWNYLQTFCACEKGFHLAKTNMICTVVYIFSKSCLHRFTY